MQTVAQVIDRAAPTRTRPADGLTTMRRRVHHPTHNHTHKTMNASARSWTNQPEIARFSDDSE
jgi:hypothetical protein